MHFCLSTFFEKSISVRPPRRQRGDFLIESLIGLLLMAIIGMGVVFVTSRMSVSQKDMRMQEIAVNQMRAELLKHGTNGINICDTTPQVELPGVDPSDITVEVIGCDEFDETKVGTTKAVINGVNIDDVPKPLFISVKSDVLGGEVIVGGRRSES